MDSGVKLYIERAMNEISTATVLLDISNNAAKKELFHIEENMTYYSGVISHSYYSIFYAAKAMLLSVNIKTDFPEVHKKTFEAFKKEFVDSGVLDVELLKIYKKIIIRADELLQIFKEEKWKRGHFTYKTMPQANMVPAQQSLGNAVKFVRNIKAVLEK